MRSAEEIRFRVRQEAANLWLFASTPSLPPDLLRHTGRTILPSPDVIIKPLRGSNFSRDIEQLAESICEHRFPLLGYVVETGKEIRWRRDYVHGVESDLIFFRRIPYLNPALAGDHKIIWELNRHQHLVVLAQAWKLTARPEFLDEIVCQLESWWPQNTFARGINWTSALEVAYRTLSWVWILHLAGTGLPENFRDQLLNELYRHGVYLEYNLSVYFSPNTHLLGEAVVLHALGVLFPHWPRANQWKSAGGRIVADEMKNQVRADGSHFEQSSAYHVYSTDLFLFHALLEPAGADYMESLRRMADYLAALSSEDGTIPLLGDDDGGRLFYPYGDQRRFGAATLATCCVFFGADHWPCLPSDISEQAAWWLPEKAFLPRPERVPSSREQLFPDAKVAILSSFPAHVLIDARAFGHANAGHSHAHALAIVCRRAGRDILIDPGTYTYVGEPEWRARFRGTAFHNTVCIDGLDQATGTGSFRWTNKPSSEVVRWIQNQEWSLLDAVCRFHGFEHRRLVLWIPRLELLAVVDLVDHVTGSSQREVHEIQQFWHCGETVAKGSTRNYRIGEALLVLPSAGEVVVSVGGEYGWQSEVPGNKVPRPVIIVGQKSALPVVFGAILYLNSAPDRSLVVEAAVDRIRLACGGLRIELPLACDPSINWTRDEQSEA